MTLAPGGLLMAHIASESYPFGMGKERERELEGRGSFIPPLAWLTRSISGQLATTLGPARSPMIAPHYSGRSFGPLWLAGQNG